jgi:hypothetical protein
MTEVFRVPRVRVNVQVALVGRRTREVSIFLGERAENHSGHERPSDVVNGDRKFLPALERDTLVFLNLEAVTMVTFAAELEYTEEELQLIEAAVQHETQRRIEVVLEDGTALNGDVAYVMPEGQRRVQDFLNGPEHFFRLKDGDRARLVNKRRVLWISQD